MKKAVLVCFLMAIFKISNAQQTEKLIIKGDLRRVTESIEQVKIRIGKNVDSCNVIDGKYSFNITLSQPSMVTVEFWPKLGVNPFNYQNMKKYRHNFYFEAGVTTITCLDSMLTCETKGSKFDVGFQDFSMKYNNFLQKNIKTTDSLYKLERKLRESNSKSDNEDAKRLDGKFISKYTDSIKAEFCFKYVLDNPENPVLFFILKEAYGYPFNGERLKPVFEKLPVTVQNSLKGKELKKMIEISLHFGLGKAVPDFTQADTSGAAFTLSSLRGKYVLLDFWGSWCGPCRQESANMLKAFNKYKGKGFTIVGVASETDKQTWLNAINEDHTGIWIHVSDFKSPNEVAELFNVHSYPTNYLLDPSGKILAINLRGAMLEEKLSELLQ